MKAMYKAQKKQIICICLQVLLVVVCLVSILAMDLWDVGEGLLGRLGSDVSNAPDHTVPAAAQPDVRPDAPSDDRSDDGADTHPNAEPDTQSQDMPTSDRSDYSNQNNGDNALTDATAAFSKEGTLYSQGDTVAQRVDSLLVDSTAWDQGEVDYAALYAHAVEWKAARVFFRYDELAYLFLQVMRATTGKAKTCYYTASKVLSATDAAACIRVDIDFVLTNKLLSFLYGKGSQQLSITFDIALVGDGLTLRDLQIEGDKRLNANLISLGSDVLFGTTDYKGYVDGLMRATCTHLGRVQSMTSTGILFDTAVLSQ